MKIIIFILSRLNSLHVLLLFFMNTKVYLKNLQGIDKQALVDDDDAKQYIAVLFNQLNFYTCVCVFMLLIVVDVYIYICVRID